MADQYQTDFGEIIGSFLVGLAQARRMADEQTAALAEYYQSHPLLQGMSVPRVRVPEMSIEVPLLLLGHRQAEPVRLRAPDDLMTGLAMRLDESLRNAAVSDEERAALQQRSEQILASRLRSVAQPDESQPATVEGMQRAVGEALEAALSDDEPSLRPASRLSAEDRERIARDVRDYLDRNALEQPGRPSRFMASVLTSEVKEKADAANVARIRLVIKEEGLEWSVSTSGNGGVVHRSLTPE